MSDFTAEQVLGYYDVATRLPEVTDEQARAAVLNALQDEVSKGWNKVSVRFGAVWDSKGYPDAGSISDKLSSSYYRSGTERSDTMILVAVVIPEYMRTDSTKDAIPLVAAAEEKADSEAKEAARLAKLDKAAELRAEAEKLEAEAGA